MADLFDAAAMYDEDYLYFFAAPGGHTQFAAHGPVVPGAGAPAGAAAGLAWRLLDLAPGLSVLDLACGHGDLAGALAARGCAVTGLDSSAAFLDRARADAAAAGVSVEYVADDMRELPWAGRFDRVVSWSTAFGYFDDDVNRAVLDQIARVLRPVRGGADGHPRRPGPEADLRQAAVRLPRAAGLAAGRGIHRGGRLRRGRAAAERRAPADGHRRGPAVTTAGRCHR